MTTLEEQIAEAEAEPGTEEEEEAEGAEPDDEESDEDSDEEEGEPEAEAPPLAAIGPDEIKKAERAIRDQRKRLAGILGDEYVAHECLLCTGVGYLPELPPLGATFLAVEDEDGPTLVVQAPAAEPDYVQAPDKAPCDWCEAEGFVRSGSKNPHAAVVPCTKCQGNGWVMVAVDQPAPTAPAAVGDNSGAPPAPMTEGLGNDAWGRPAGHKHWGVAPALIEG